MKMTLFGLLAIAVVCLIYYADGHDHSQHESELDGGRSCAAHDFSTAEMLRNVRYARAHHIADMEGKKRAKEMKRKKHMAKKNLDRAFSRRERALASGKRQSVSESRFAESRRTLFSDYDDNYASMEVVTIPVVFHVLYLDSEENLGEAQLQSQIDVLNKDFRALNNEIVSGELDSMWDDRVGDSKLEFSLAGIERVEISDYSMCTDSKMKKSSEGGSDGWDPATYLNIWTCDLFQSSGYLGWAYYPCLLGGSTEYLDGVVINTGAVGSADDDDGSFHFDTSSFDLGRTATHEVGHYLNLAHIWGSTGCSNDDEVTDTPYQYSANYGCPSDSTDSCEATDPETGTDLRDNFENYMDYSNDACMYMFTEEQVTRMRDVVSASGCRSTMYHNGIGDGLTPSPVSVSPSPTDGGDNGEFTCDDGCSIPADFVNDGYYCDCSNCEDESDWTCSTCHSDGCSNVGCSGGFDYQYCDGSGETTNFVCDDGCDIYDGYITDGYCDCSNCEDEESYDCDSCGGCPTYCGGWVGCPGRVTEPTDDTTDDPGRDGTLMFTCDDGCEVDAAYENDDYCDCQDCSDETDWTCSNCFSFDDDENNYGCGNSCGDYRFCDKFICNDGCVIRWSKLQNDWCDCSECEDENDWTCTTCGGCPVECVDDDTYGVMCSRSANVIGEGTNGDNDDASAHQRNKAKEDSLAANNNNNNSSGLSQEWIVAIAVIASLLLLVFVVAIGVVVYRRRRKQQLAGPNHLDKPLLH